MDVAYRRPPLADRESSPQVVGPAGRGVGALLVGTDAPKAEAGLKPKVNTAKARANKAQRNRAVGGNRPGPSKKEAAKPPVLGTRRSNLKVTTRARTQIVEQVPLQFCRAAILHCHSPSLCGCWTLSIFEYIYISLYRSERGEEE